jgi:hypothetical protein
MSKKPYWPSRLLFDPGPVPLLLGLVSELGPFLALTWSGLPWLLVWLGRGFELLVWWLAALTTSTTTAKINKTKIINRAVLKLPAFLGGVLSM